MSDLISRSALMQSLRNNVLVDVTLNLEQAIDKQPAAYDVDKVVERLEEKVLGLQSLDTSEQTVDVAIKELQRSIEIVKSGFNQ